MVFFMTMSPPTRAKYFRVVFL